MKGTLHKTDKDWIVAYKADEVITHLPVLKRSLNDPTFSTYWVDGREVEFSIIPCVPSDLEPTRGETLSFEAVKYAEIWLDDCNVLEAYDPYCPVCSGCGEDGCCPATFCQQSPDGRYCETYLRELKFGYQMYKDMYDLIPKDEETQKKLDEIWNTNYDHYLNLNND